MTLHIETGHVVTADVRQIAGHTVRFVTEDGRCAFEVRAGKDGRSLEIRGVECIKAGGVLYCEALQVRPHASNSVTVSNIPYDEKNT